MPPLNTAALLGPTVARGSSRTMAPILIQVPALASTSWRQAQTRPTGSRPRRRRLKREVRIAGASLLIALPLAWATPFAFRSIPLRGASNSVAPSVSASLASFEPPPMISLRLEAVSQSVTNHPSILASPVTPSDVPRIPVVLRGDILPDDGSMEGTAHAGS